MNKLFLPFAAALALCLATSPARADPLLLGLLATVTNSLLGPIIGQAALGFTIGATGITLGAAIGGLTTIAVGRGLSLGPRT